MHSDYRELLSIFNAHRAKYLVIGAYAVAIHAQPRATKDIDILVKADPENARAVIAALAAFGATLEGMTSADFEEPGPFFPIGREPVGDGRTSPILKQSKKQRRANRSNPQKKVPEAGRA
jgi:hypothetical protein